MLMLVSFAFLYFVWIVLAFWFSFKANVSYIYSIYSSNVSINIDCQLILLLTINHSPLGNLLKTFHRGLMKDHKRVCFGNTTSNFFSPSNRFPRGLMCVSPCFSGSER